MYVHQDLKTTLLLVCGLLRQLHQITLFAKTETMNSLLPSFLYWIGLALVLFVIVYALPWIIYRTIKDLYQQSGREGKLLFYSLNAVTMLAYALIVITFLIFNLKYLG